MSVLSMFPSRIPKSATSPRPILTHPPNRYQSTNPSASTAQTTTQSSPSLSASRTPSPPRSPPPLPKIPGVPDPAARLSPTPSSHKTSSTLPRKQYHHLNTHGQMDREHRLLSQTPLQQAGVGVGVRQKQEEVQEPEQELEQAPVQVREVPQKPVPRPKAVIRRI